MVGTARAASIAHSAKDSGSGHLPLSVMVVAIPPVEIAPANSANSERLRPIESWMSWMTTIGAATSKGRTKLPLVLLIATTSANTAQKKYIAANRTATAV